tara:strand:- start:694 stop:1506 length:813 start_codon:yes stop_codon:yes gene_type:complete
MKTREQLKQEHREAREAHRAAKHQNRLVVESESATPIDCACVIHADFYSWKYVDTLYSMLSRNLSRPVRMHVYTEEHRAVPSHMIKHVLTEWPGIRGSNKSWWYKMQLFNPEHHSGQLLYLDLDIVIVNSLDWITQLNPTCFWAIRDFTTLWNPRFQGINSSIMYWNTQKFAKVWEEFNKHDIFEIFKRHHGDQEYLDKVLTPKERRFFPEKSAVSWRWQALDGGINPTTRKHLNPGLGTQIGPDTSLLIFHGQPKPDQVTDPVIKTHWH